MVGQHGAEPTDSFQFHRNYPQACADLDLLGINAASMFAYLDGLVAHIQWLKANEDEISDQRIYSQSKLRNKKKVTQKRPRLVKETQL